MPLKRTEAAAKKVTPKKRTVSAKGVAPKLLGTKRKGIKLSNGSISSFGRSKIPREDECYGPLDDASQKAAKIADDGSTLFMLDGKLKCSCGKMVSARKSSMGDYYEPTPRPHSRYKEPRRPALKPGGGKRNP